MGHQALVLPVIGAQVGKVPGIGVPLEVLKIDGQTGVQRLTPHPDHLSPWEAEIGQPQEQEVLRHLVGNRLRSV